MVNEHEWPPLVTFSMSLADEVLTTQGNIVSPVIIYQKDSIVQESIVVDIPECVMGYCDIQERVRESLQSFVYEKSPEELVVVMEGFFVGDGSGDRCVALTYSCPKGERYWVARVMEQRLESWREILIFNSWLFSDLYEKAVYRWN
jgi:hypothetical protein